MKREKVTMKDIAEELGLSLATVSYVLNHSDKEKISHDTRIKVMETAKRLGYVPNQTAKSLAKNRSNLVGIIVNLSHNASSYMKQQAMDLASELQQQIYEAGYDTILSIAYELEDIQITYKHSLEAVFIIDVSEKALRKITKHYYVPLIFLDCDFDEGLFYKILPDYQNILPEAKKLLNDDNPYLIMDHIINDRIKEQISELFRKEDIYIHKNNSNLKEFLSGKTNRKGIVIGDLLGMQVERYVDNSNILVISSNPTNDLLLPDTKRITISNTQKALVAIAVLKKLIALDYDENPRTRILLLPDPPKEILL
ncbi:MAG: transcriptional regulator, LacI family [Herbinix sp.]|nr:transcriptional regulator, LacI family [Herbinix sp.]